jgi:LytR cell envelope-related transcriptional attenuator
MEARPVFFRHVNNFLRMGSSASRQTTFRSIFLNSLIAALSIFILYLIYALSFAPSHQSVAPNTTQADYVPNSKIVQVDVLNGCGTPGVGEHATEFLRATGYDVVEMGNYKAFDVKESMVIDRSGNLDVAEKIAKDFGINQKNVVQQISPDYFVTASVIIGKDYKSLAAWK